MSDTSADVVAPTPPVAASENIGRGTLFALLTIPAGVAAWVIVWGLGYVASLVGFLVAFLALRLYVWGAGRISRAGAAIVLVTTVIALLLAFVGGMAYDVVVGVSAETGVGAWAVLTDPDFWPAFVQYLPEAFPEYLPDFAWAMGFGALGSFAVLRSAFAAGKAEPEPEPAEAPATSADPQAATPDQA